MNPTTLYQNTSQATSASVSSAVSSLATSEVFSRLSVPAQGIVTTIGNAVQQATGQDLAQLATSALTNIADTVLEDVTDVVSDVSSAVPIIGTIIKTALAYVNLVEGELAAADAARIAHSENNLIAPVVPIDTVDATPADVFAPIYGPSGNSGKVIPNETGNGEIIPYAYGPFLVPVTDGLTATNASMPTLGMMLTSLTENIGWGGPVAGVWPNDGIGVYQGLREAIDAVARAKLGVNANGVGPGLGNDTVGTDVNNGNEWLALFKRVRQAISLSLVRQSDPSRPGPMGSDEGASLWPIYLDMLRALFDEGIFTRDYLIYFFNQGSLTPDIPAGTRTNCYGADCEPGEFEADMTPYVDALISTVDKWRAQVNPVSAQDQNSYATLLADVERATAQSAAKVVDAALAPLASPTLSAHDRAIAEVKARAVGATNFQIAAASPLGWSPSASPTLANVETVAILFPKWRAYVATKPKVSPATVQAFSSLSKLFAK